MKKFLAAICMAMLLVITGCSGSGEETETPDAGLQNLRVAIGGQISTLDPGLSTEITNNYILRHICGNLFHQDENGEIANELASGYTVSEDGLTYTITLREGVLWSDGQPLTSKDFEFTLLRNLVYGAENAWSVYFPSSYIVGAEEIVADENFDPMTDSIEGIQTPDDQTLVFKLKKPCTWFPQMLSNNVWIPLRSDFVDIHDSLWSLKPGYPSVGAYVLKEVNENEKAVVVKNENYWDAENVTVPEITFMVMPDSDAQSLAFKNGEIDVALNVPKDLIGTYENQDEIWIIPEISNYSISLNCGETGPEALKNVDVRRALALALDKETITEVVGSKGLYVPLYGYIPTGFKGVSKDFRTESDEVLKFLEYDPEEAKALLEKAGYNESNPLKLKYKYSQGDLHPDVAQIVEQMWAAVGVDVELEIVESGVFYDQMDGGDFETGRYGYVVSDDPSQFLTLWTTGQQIVPAVSDPVYDKMVEDAGYLTDRTEYMKALHEAEYYLIEENVYHIPLFSYNTPCLVKENLTNYKKWGLGLFFGYVTEK